jgi:signal transduction histidine kinase/CheY-like chemotaxis protein
MRFGVAFSSIRSAPSTDLDLGKEEEEKSHRRSQASSKNTWYSKNTFQSSFAAKCITTLIVVAGLSVSAILTNAAIRNEVNARSAAIQNRFVLLQRTVNKTFMDIADQARGAASVVRLVDREDMTVDKLETITSSFFTFSTPELVTYWPIVPGDERDAFVERSSEQLNAYYGTNTTYEIKENAGTGELAPFRPLHRPLRAVVPPTLLKDFLNFDDMSRGLNVETPLGLINGTFGFEYARLYGVYISDPILINTIGNTREQSIIFFVNVPGTNDALNTIINLVDVIRSILMNINSKDILVKMYDEGDKAGVGNSDRTFLIGALNSASENVRRVSMEVDDLVMAGRSSSGVPFYYTKTEHILDEMKDLTQTRSFKMKLANNREYTFTMSILRGFNPIVRNSAIGIGTFGAIFTLFLALALNRVTRVDQRFAQERATFRVRTELKAERARLEAERDTHQVMAHEVRNPLSVAISAAAFCRSEVDKSSQIGKDLLLVERSLRYINDLLSDLLDIHSLESGDLPTRMSPMNVYDVLVSVADILRQTSSDVTITVMCPPDVQIRGDFIRLKQVIMNLGRNSTKFTQSGFVKFVCTVRNDAIVQIAVEDSGPGVSEEVKARLFKKFTTSISANNTRGTGLGLPLVKKLTEAMGGTVYLDENYTSGFHDQPGSRFVIELPHILPSKPLAIPPDVHNSVAVLPDIENGLAGILDESAPFLVLPRFRKVLIVDDDINIRMTFTRTIKMTCPEWDVTTAESGAEALEYLDAHRSAPPDLIILDHFMPGMRGLEVMRTLRRRGMDDIADRVVGSSANDMEANYLKVGARAFWRKPWVEDVRQRLFDACDLPTDARFVVADDVVVNRRTFTRVLNKLFPLVPVDGAESGADLVEMLKKRPYTAAFLDEMMPPGPLGSVLMQDILENGPFEMAVIHVSGKSDVTLPAAEHFSRWTKPLPADDYMTMSVKRCVFAASYVVGNSDESE